MIVPTLRFAPCSRIARKARFFVPLRMTVSGEVCFLGRHLAHPMWLRSTCNAISLGEVPGNSADLAQKIADPVGNDGGTRTGQGRAAVRERFRVGQCGLELPLWDSGPPFAQRGEERRRKLLRYSKKCLSLQRFSREGAGSRIINN